MNKRLSALVFALSLMASPALALTTGGDYWDGSRDGGTNGCYADTRTGAIACSVAVWIAKGAYAAVASDDGTTVTYEVWWGGTPCAPAGNYTPEPSDQVHAATNWSGVSGVSNVTIEGTTFDDATLTSAYSVYTGGGGGDPDPVNGSCGSSAGICLVGSVSGLSDNGTTTTWSCLGSDGGTDAPCSVDNPEPDVDGV